MTVSNDKMPSSEPNDTEEKEEELILVDLTTVPDDIEVDMTPLNSFQDDDLQEHDEPVVVEQLQEEETEEKDDDDLLVMKPTRIEQTQQVQFPQNITTNLYADYYSYQDTEDEPVAIPFEEEVSEPAIHAAKSSTVYNKTTVDSSGMTVAVLSQFISKQENLNKKQDKRIQDGINAVKLAALITYSALSIAVISLVAVIVIAVMLAKAHTNIEQLQTTIVSLKDDLESVALKVSATQTTDKSFSEQTPITTREPASKSPVEEIDSEKIEEDLPIPAPIVADAMKIQPPTEEKSTATTTETNPVTASKATNITPKPVIISVSKNPVTTQTANKTTETKPGVWHVKVEASKNQALIKNKAKILAKKGIPVKVVPIVVNKVTWYRIQTGTFKDKQTATAYAAKINKAQKLNAVAVNN